MIKFINRVITFLHQVKVELKRVRWPSQKEIRKLTLVVILSILSLGLYIGILDTALTKLIELGIK
ncbi:preprotein translocase subunit SecE [Patescibacteria group bacterium]|nr:preprotein translocase subunit SecE [Patescibacteria group bacterium]MBU1868352.1 preprotein translocase subunit SecE [Patescibacteria group bacterium]